MPGRRLPPLRRPLEDLRNNCTLGVNGCGQQVTYVHVPNGAWVMNNALKS